MLHCIILYFDFSFSSSDMQSPRQSEPHHSPVHSAMDIDEDLPIQPPPPNEILFIQELYNTPILHSSFHSIMEIETRAFTITPHDASAAANSLCDFTFGTLSTSESVFAEAQRTAWLPLQESYQAAGQLDLVANSLRACWMMGHWTWWKYLRTHVPEAVHAYMNSDGSKHPLGSCLTTLAQYIDKNIMKYGGGYVVFSAVFPQEPNAICPAAFLPHQNSAGADRYNLLVHNVCRTLSQWLALPLYSRDRVFDWDTRGIFLEIILSRFPALLLHPAVYRAFCNPTNTGLPASINSLIPQLSHFCSSPVLIYDMCYFTSTFQKLFPHFKPFPNKDHFTLISNKYPISVDDAALPLPYEMSTPLPPVAVEAGQGILQFLLDIQALHGVSVKPEGFVPIERALVCATLFEICSNSHLSCSIMRMSFQALVIHRSSATLCWSTLIGGHPSERQRPAVLLHCRYCPPICEPRAAFSALQFSVVSPMDLIFFFNVGKHTSPLSVHLRQHVLGYKDIKW